MESPREKEAFSVVKRAKSFAHAFRGIKLLIATQPNVILHALAAAAAIVLGCVFAISATEWLFIVIAIGMVIAAEAFNTAMEFDINLTSPEYHPYARDTKDVAAGAVLLMSIAACAIGVTIFVPKIMHRYF